MAAETVTVKCSKHLRRCTLAETPKGGGIRIRHAGPGDTGPCDSERFTVRREYTADRPGAHAELVALDCLARARAAADSSKEGSDAG